MWIAILMMAYIIYLLKFKGVKMAESAEVTAFRVAVTASLANISADIQRLLARQTGLSEEDKAALTQIAADLAAVASVVPEPEPEPVP